METELTLGGMWGFTLLMVIIASWILYRYVAPRNWKEWTRAGLIQAFKENDNTLKLRPEMHL